MNGEEKLLDEYGEDYRRGWDAGYEVGYEDGIDRMDELRVEVIRQRGLGSQSTMNLYSAQVRIAELEAGRETEQTMLRNAAERIRELEDALSLLGGKDWEAAEVQRLELAAAIEQVRSLVMNTDGDYLHGSDFDGLAGEIQAVVASTDTAAILHEHDAAVWDSAITELAAYTGDTHLYFNPYREEQS